jgi:hypothetical protein
MKLQYVHDNTDGGKYPQAYPIRLLRLYHFNTNEVNDLILAIENWLQSGKEELQIDSLAFIQPENIKLTFRISDEDKGIITDDQKHFFCMLPFDSYKNMIELMKPFLVKTEAQNYQWLYEWGYNVEFLFSPDGAW